MNLIKRAMSYIMFKGLAITPITISWLFLSYPITSTYMEATHNVTDGFYLIGLELFSIFLPVTGWGILSRIGEENYYFTLVPLALVILCYIIYESLMLIIFKGSILGRFAFNIKLASTTDKPLKWWRILYRTTLKYLSIAFFCPILLFPLFNKQRLFFHEWASGVCKMEATADKTEPPSKNTVYIDDEEKKFYEEQSKN